MSYNQKKFLDYDGLIHLLKKFDDYPTNDILGTVIDSIGAAIDAKVSDVQVNGTSILNNGVANVPWASSSNPGVVRISGYGLLMIDNTLSINAATSDNVKAGVHGTRPIVPSTQDASTFYGLAKAAGDTTQSQSSNAVGTYTNDAKAAIQTMLDVPSNATVISAIGTAIGNIHQFSIEVVQALPTENIQEHTVYFVPKTGETNDVYDEYVYVNNGWEMIGNTQIDLSNYVQKTDYATSSTAGVIKTGEVVYLDNENKLRLSGATATQIKNGANTNYPITPSLEHSATFYGLAKAAGDTTQSQSDNVVGTYTNDAKTAIRVMLGVPSSSDLNDKADKSNTILSTTLSLGRRANTTIGTNSIALGDDLTASGAYSFAEGRSTSAGGTYAHAMGYNTNAPGRASLAAGITATASGEASFAFGRGIASYGSYMAGFGVFPIVPTTFTKWTANTSYNVGDLVKNDAVGYKCIEANSDATFTASKWQMIYYTSDIAFFIGNGTSSNNRSNALKIDIDGNMYIKKDIYVNCNTDSSGGTKLVSQTDYATESTAGVVKIAPGSSSSGGIEIINGSLCLSTTVDSIIKNGTSYKRAVMPHQQHIAAFYGLAKAAGADEKDSTLPLGTYSNTAKTAIQNMLGVTDALAVKLDVAEAGLRVVRLI